MFLRSLWSVFTNITTIESWEIERHETLLRRSRVLGGYLEGFDGVKIRIQRQEFPYDIGIWKNIRQAMSGGPLVWIWPFAVSYPITGPATFEVNGFEDPSTTWPPPDPDRIPKRAVTMNTDDAFIHDSDATSNSDQLKAFRQRQHEDLRRYGTGNLQIYRRRPFHERYATFESDKEQEEQDANVPAPNVADGEEAWRNSEGDRLQDFGVDEAIEFYDEDDVPLAVLLTKKRYDPHS
ncbi:Palmitoyltransferase [Lambiella insularis]|nr:Palmitoyltransferase [Lambiella insularis]